MTALLQIEAQYYENYNFTGEGEPSFRPKGGQIFHVEVDAELLTYVGNEDLIQACRDTLETRSNGAVRFQYLGHKVLFCEPIEINKDEFKQELMKHFD